LDDADDDGAWLRQYAIDTFGWKFIQVENGSWWDFCPDCYEKHRIESNNK
jgi:hypothetical protein